MNCVEVAMEIINLLSFKTLMSSFKELNFPQSTHSYLFVSGVFLHSEFFARFLDVSISRKKYNLINVRSQFAKIEGMFNMFYVPCLLTNFNIFLHIQVSQKS
jgi:hypothetical protein